MPQSIEEITNSKNIATTFSYGEENQTIKQPLETTTTNIEILT